MNPLKGLATGTHAVPIMLVSLACVSALLIIMSFWPGSIGHDYHITLMEAASWRFEGHQPPTAAVATWLLTLGTADPTIVFVIKVVAYFAALGIFLLGARAPLIVQLGAAAIVFSPAFFYLVPIVRNNLLHLVFLGLALAAGLAGKTAWRSVVASLSLILAAMFSSAPHLGHVALVVLFFLWQFPQWQLRRTAIFSAASIIALWVPVQTAKIVSGNIDRNSTLYISALNGIGGLYDSGEKTCLGNDILRGGAASPEEVFAKHYAHPFIYMPLWTEPKGFKLPVDVSPEQRRNVISCWVKTIFAKPGEFIAERAGLALMSMRTSALESQFVWLHRDGEYILNPGYEQSGYGIELNGIARAIVAYGQFGNMIMLGSIKPYLAVFLLTALAVLILTNGRRLFVLFGALSVLGFMMPQLLLAQHPMFRYFVEAAYVASWLSLAHIWILATDTLTPPPWLLRVWRGAANRSSLIARFAPPPQPPASMSS